MNDRRFDFIDSQVNPILTPSDTAQSKAVFNSAVILDRGMFHMLYRLQRSDDELTGRIMLATGTDSFRLTPCPDPVLVPEHDWEKFGCEDPRVVKFNGSFYLTYNGAYTWSPELKYYSQACLATSEDLVRWKKHGPLLKPQEGTWCWMGHKSAAIIPERINNQYVMYFEGRGIPGPGQERIGIAYSQDLVHWHADFSGPVLAPRDGLFDSKGVEPGCVVVTDDGILLIYNSWNWDNVFRPGWALFAREEPARLLARCSEPLLNRKEKIIFTESLVQCEGRWLLCYRLNDLVINVAISKEET